MWDTEQAIQEQKDVEDAFELDSAADNLPAKLSKFIEGYWFGKEADGDMTLLPDTGACVNLCGWDWAIAASASARMRGTPVHWQEIPRQEHCGVGSGNSFVQWRMTLPITVGTRKVKYSTLVCSQKELPALMGLISLAAWNVLIEPKTGKFHMPGPGGFDLKLSPGSETVSMAKRERHERWLLPINKGRDEEHPKGQPVESISQRLYIDRLPKKTVAVIRSNEVRIEERPLSNF